MSHYEYRSYTGWMRHMQFVMIAHLFATEIKEIVKKGILLTFPMAVKLLQEYIHFNVVCMKEIICYRIRRNHSAYLSHRKKMLNCAL